jgi:hypothetical protein
MVKQLYSYFPFLRKKEKTQFTITIPDPCNEVWSEMNVVDDMHRHCGACERTLTDFSVMSDDELIIFFRQNNGKVCGRFRKDQLNRPFAQLPERTTKAAWWKAAALLPLSFFSRSANAQQLSTDSVPAAQPETPMVALTDTALPPVCVAPWVFSNDSVLHPSPFTETYVIGIPPPYLWRVDPGITVSTVVFEAPVDSLYPVSDSSVGAPARTVSAKKLQSAPQDFANNFGALSPQKED